MAYWKSALTVVTLFSSSAALAEPWNVSGFFAPRTGGGSPTEIVWLSVTNENGSALNLPPRSLEAMTYGCTATTCEFIIARIRSVTSGGAGVYRVVVQRASNAPPPAAVLIRVWDRPPIAAGGGEGTQRAQVIIQATRN